VERLISPALLELRGEIYRRADDCEPRSKWLSSFRNDILPAFQCAAEDERRSSIHRVPDVIAFLSRPPRRFIPHKVDPSHQWQSGPDGHRLPVPAECSGDEQGALKWYCIPSVTVRAESSGYQLFVISDSPRHRLKFDVPRTARHCPTVFFCGCNPNRVSN
jgi:hypothetical protein